MRTPSLIPRPPLVTLCTVAGGGGGGAFVHDGRFNGRAEDHGGTTGFFIGEGVLPRPVSVPRSTALVPRDSAGCPGCGAPPEPIGVSACSYCGRSNGSKPGSGAAFARYAAAIVTPNEARERYRPPQPANHDGSPFSVVFPARPVRGEIFHSTAGPYTWDGGCWRIGEIVLSAPSWEDRFYAIAITVCTVAAAALINLPPEVIRELYLGQAGWLFVGTVSVFGLMAYRWGKKI